MTLLTLNIWNLPFITKDKHLRMQRLITGLEEMRPDIICLQESWEPEVRKLLLSSLREYQIPDICSGKRLGGFFDSTGGLLIMTRMPVVVTSVIFNEFFENGFLCFEDRIGRKGFLAARVTVNDRSFVVVNTHLHVRMLGSYRHHRDVRIRQLEQLCSFVNSSTQQLPTILLGDFNFESRDEEYRVVFGAHFRDLSSNLESNWNQRGNCYDATYFNTLLTRRSKVDYIFAKNIGSMVWNTRKVFDSPPISDHYGILAKIHV